ncbi:hypothetical protein GCM10023116_12570 [Kistimonas scapharcae]|uniref:MarR family transcriptional regulator n=1 Tax=Kistimonas scapharcae TaxID=1036133 RepID=A0ABP8V0L9_9GAMM
MDKKIPVYYTNKYGFEKFKYLNRRHVHLLRLIFYSETYEYGPPRNNNLCKYLDITPQTLTTYSCYLTRTKLVKRTPDKRLALTDKGRAWCEEHFSPDSKYREHPAFAI